MAYHPMRLKNLPPIDLQHEAAVTPMAFIRSVVSAYKKYGHSPKNALEMAHISSAQLGQPNAFVTASQMEMMSAVAMQELDDEALGWFSRKLPWGTYGMLCRASLGAENLGIALNRWCRHHRLITDDITLQLDNQGPTINPAGSTVGATSTHFSPTDGQTATLSICCHKDLGELTELCLVTCLRYVLGYACWVVDSTIALNHAGFPYPQPPHHAVYPMLFNGPVYFDQACASISFDAQYLRLPLLREESHLNQMLKRALPLTVLQYKRDRLLIQKVRQYLKHTSFDLSTTDALANALNMSTRTLQRRLHEEGTTLNSLKEEARCELAKDLLARSKKQIKQIALEIGYSSEKSFSRAFKEWTGAGPSHWRRR